MSIIISCNVKCLCKNKMFENLLVVSFFSLFTIIHDNRITFDCDNLKTNIIACTIISFTIFTILYWVSDHLRVCISLIMISIEFVCIVPSAPHPVEIEIIVGLRKLCLLCAHELHRIRERETERESAPGNSALIILIRSLHPRVFASRLRIPPIHLHGGCRDC